jgi:hypothetical protein
MPKEVSRTKKMVLDAYIYSLPIKISVKVFLRDPVMNRQVVKED